MCTQNPGEAAIVDDELAFSNDRTQSRLQEMQSAQYLADHAKEHVPHTFPALQVWVGLCCNMLCPAQMRQSRSSDNLSAAKPSWLNSLWLEASEGCHLVLHWLYAVCGHAVLE